jgi:predicted amidohydrolase
MTNQNIRIGLVQMRCEKGAVQENLESMRACVAEARQRGVEIVGFPEMSIGGYADPKRYPQAVMRLDGPEMGRFLALSAHSSQTVLAGLIEQNERADAKPTITQIAARDGRLLGCYRKITIKDEEELWFSPGRVEPPVFQHNDLSFGMAICADISNEAVFAACQRQGARLVFELAAPGLYGEQATRNWRSGFEWWRGECQQKLSAYAASYGLWIAVATQAGRTVDEDFPGGGYVFAPDGRCLFATPDGSEGAAYMEIDMEENKVTLL